MVLLLADQGPVSVFAVGTLTMFAEDGADGCALSDGGRGEVIGSGLAIHSGESVRWIFSPFSCCSTTCGIWWTGRNGYMLLLRPLSETVRPGCADVGGLRGGDVCWCIVHGSLADGCAACVLVGFPNPNASFPFTLFAISFPSPKPALSCFTTRTPIFAPVLSSIACSRARTSDLIEGVADDVVEEEMS